MDLDTIHGSPFRNSKCRCIECSSRLFYNPVCYCDAANPGDTIYVAPGIYKEYLIITTDGLTIEGAGIDLSIIDLDGLIPYWHYDGCSSSYASRAGVMFSGYGSLDEIISDCTFRGFTVTNAGLNPPTPYFHFYDDDEDGQDNVRGLGIANGKNILIQYCKVTNSGYGGINVGKARCTSLRQSENVTIDNCISSYHPAVGISVGDYKGAITITNNECSNNISPHFSDPTREYRGKGILVSGNSSIKTITGIIANNVCRNNGFEGIEIKKWTDGIIVENNTVAGHFFDEDSSGIFMYYWGKPERCKNHIIRKNKLPRIIIPH